MGSSGLGLSLAHRFGKAGIKLVLAARSKDDLESARRQLLGEGSVVREEDVLLVVCDVSDKHQASHLIGAALDTFRRLDILINNAGIIEVGPAENQSVKVYEKAMATDFFGAVYTTYAALPFFLAQRCGSIVNISSVGGKIPFHISFPTSLPSSPSPDSLKAFMPNFATRGFV